MATGLANRLQFGMDVQVTNPQAAGHAPDPDPAPGAAPDARDDSEPPPRFDFVLRGYDRVQVDVHLDTLMSRFVDASEQLRAAVARVADERRRADLAERRLREVHAEVAAQTADQRAAVSAGFGQRAERMLRAAEAEAREIREAATADAAEFLQRARTTAEAHRHDIEQNLILRATTLDQQAAELAAALRDREQAGAAELASARAEAEAVRANARQELATARDRAEQAAEQIRAETRQWAVEYRARVDRELSELVELRKTARSELDRIASLLRTEVGPRPTADAADPAPADRPSPVAEVPRQR